MPLLQTSSADVSDVISNRQLAQMPLNGRQFLQLAPLTDGIAVPSGGTRGAALATDAVWREISVLRASRVILVGRLRLHCSWRLA